MKRTEESGGSVPPVYKYLFPFLFLLLLLSCSTGEGMSADGNRSSEGSVSIVSHDESAGSPSVGDDKTYSGERETAGYDWLEAARIAWFDRKDREETLYCLDRVEKSGLGEESRASLYRLLCRKVYTMELPLESLGFTDRNISSLFLDGDDLWMGTWTGGIARYSLPLGDLTLIRESRENLRVETITDFEEVDKNIRIAGYSDIYGYDKRTSRLITTTPEKMGRINSLAFFGGIIYASTVNQGLWYENLNRQWVRLGENQQGLDRINVIRTSADGSTLLIGTAASGVIEFDGKYFRYWRDLYPDFKGKNITSFDERDDYILLGTYGEGGYLIKRSIGSMAHYTKGQGDLLSDYVLAVSLEGDYALMGSLGGGISARERRGLDRKGKWITLGLEEGLNSLDVTALAVFGKTLYAAVLGQGVLILDEDIIEKSL